MCERGHDHDVNKCLLQRRGVARAREIERETEKEKREREERKKGER